MEKIKDSDIVDQYVQDMVTYLIVANRRRSISDVRDSFKPVQRRIIYDMAEEVGATTKNVKSARIVGDVMGKYHPHGDSSIYDAMAPLVNWFSAKVPLIVGKGNWGTISDDPCAAMRYTEAHLSDFCLEYVVGPLKESKRVVNWIKNFDETEMEPEYLPTMVPLLLVNGGLGIGVGMRMDIPKHNLAEVIDTTVTLIDNPNAPVVLIPDPCTDCFIIDTNWKQICNTGSGTYRVRGIIEEGMIGKSQALFIKSIPDKTNTKAITKSINTLIEEGKLPQVSEVNDASTSNKNKKKKDGDPINIIVKLRKGADPYYVKEVLYKSCNVEMSYTVNFEAINDIEPMRFSYKAYLLFFIELSSLIQFRLYSNRLQKVKTRWHELEPFIKVASSPKELHKVMSMLQGKRITEEAAVEKLIKLFDITDLQALRIIRSRLIDLTATNLDLKVQEGKELQKKIKEYENVINHPEIILSEIKENLIRCKEKYGKPRQAKIIKDKSDGNIPQGNFKIIITESNKVRKIGENDAPNIVKGDKPRYILPVENTESIIVMDNKGKMHKLDAYRVQICGRQDGGVDIRTLLKSCTANIAAVFYVPTIKYLANLRRKHYAVIVTENNCIKKLSLEDLLTVLPSGLIYTKLNNGDTVKDVQLVADDLDILVYSKHKALRFPIKEIPLYKRSTYGVGAMNTKEPIGGLSVVYPDAIYVIVVTANGKANKFNIAGLALSSRFKAGSQVIKLSKGDSIIGIFTGNDNDSLILDTVSGQMTISVADIKMESSISAGNKLPIDRGDFIIKANLVSNK